MSQTILLNDNCDIINIETFNEHNIYVVYNKHKTTISSLKKKLFENYECKGDNIKYIDEIKLEDVSTGSYLENNDCNTLLSEIISNNKFFKMKLSRYCDSPTDLSYLQNKLNNATNKFEVTIKSLTGKCLSFEVTNNMTVYELKSLIFHSKERIPVSECKIIYSGIQLENEKALEFYNITPHAVLHLILSLRGGMFHESSGKNGGYQQLHDIIIYVDQD